MVYFGGVLKRFLRGEREKKKERIRWGSAEVITSCSNFRFARRKVSKLGWHYGERVLGWASVLFRRWRQRSRYIWGRDFALRGGGGRLQTCRGGSLRHRAVNNRSRSPLSQSTLGMNLLRGLRRYPWNSFLYDTLSDSLSASRESAAIWKIGARVWISDFVPRHVRFCTLSRFR